MSNTTSKPINIANGADPWDYDPVATSFEVISNGQPLAREGGFPLIGRPGPKVLASGAKESGDLPITDMFPQLAALIGTKPATIRWAYWTAAEEKDGDGRIEGILEIRKDPCVK